MLLCALGKTQYQHTLCHSSALSPQILEKLIQLESVLLLGELSAFPLLRYLLLALEGNQ